MPSTSHFHRTDLVNKSLHSLNTAKIRDVVSKTEKRSSLKSNNYETPKLSKKRSDFRASYKSKQSSSRSVVQSKTRISREPKGKNEYGLTTLKTYRINTKSFHESAYTINSIKNEKTQLEGKEIDRYIKMLSCYVKNNEDSKVITTLKILLNHYTRKCQNSHNVQKSKGRINSFGHAFSPREKKKLVSMINTQSDFTPGMPYYLLAK